MNIVCPDSYIMMPVTFENFLQNLLDVLEKDGDESKHLFADCSRKMTVLRVNERSLTRQYTNLLEMEKYLRKENEKMKTELVSMEAAVREKIGYLQRFKVCFVSHALYVCITCV